MKIRRQWFTTPKFHYLRSYTLVLKYWQCKAHCVHFVVSRLFKPKSEIQNCTILTCIGQSGIFVISTVCNCHCFFSRRIVISQDNSNLHAWYHTCCQRVKRPSASFAVFSLLFGQFRSKTVEKGKINKVVFLAEDNGNAIRLIKCITSWGCMHNFCLAQNKTECSWPSDCEEGRKEGSAKH